MKNFKLPTVMLLAVLALLPLLSGCNSFEKAAYERMHKFSQALDSNNYASAWKYVSAESQDYVAEFVQNDMPDHPEFANMDYDGILNSLKTGKGIVPEAYWTQFKQQIPWDELKTADWQIKESDQHHIVFEMVGNSNWIVVCSRGNDGLWYYEVPRG